MSPHIGNISLPIIKPTEPVKRFYSDKLAAMIDEVIRHTHTHMQYNTCSITHTITVFPPG